MAVWYVFQGLNFALEEQGGFLWAPAAGPTGARVPHWANVGRVRAGDVIYSARRKVIAHVLVAQADAGPAHRPPPPYPQVAGQSNDGNLVRVSFFELSRPYLSHGKIAAECLDLFSGPGRPLDVNGDGRQGYLFELDESAADYLRRVTWRGQSEAISAAVERARRG